jgi:hypothetical protein
MKIRKLPIPSSTGSSMDVTITQTQEDTKMPPTHGGPEIVEANQQTRSINFQQAIEFRSKRQSFALATAIHQLLPRELRDLIWEAYLQENSIDWYRVCYNTYWNSVSFRKFSYLPHFLLPEYSSMEAAREIGQIAYKVAKFNLRDFVGVLQLRHILEFDHLNLNLVPKDFIRDLTIMVDTTEMHEKTSIPGDPIAMLKELSVNLNALLDVRMKHSLNLRINFSYRNGALEVAEILHEFLPVWIELKEQKANVMVQYKRSIKSRKERPLIELSDLLVFPTGEWRWRILDKCSALGRLTAWERHWTEEVWQKTLSGSVGQDSTIEQVGRRLGTVLWRRKH